MLQEAHLYLVPQFLRPLRTFAVVTSMYTTVMIAFDRYFAVSKPLMSFVERDDDNWKSVAKKMKSSNFDSGNAEVGLGTAIF